MTYRLISLHHKHIVTLFSFQLKYVKYQVFVQNGPLVSFLFLSVEAAVMFSSYHVPYCALSPLCHVTDREPAALSNSIKHRGIEQTVSSSSHDVLIEQRTECKGGVQWIPALFRTA